jgi:hypothetical protein
MFSGFGSIQRVMNSLVLKVIGANPRHFRVYESRHGEKISWQTDPLLDESRVIVHNSLA